MRNLKLDLLNIETLSLKKVVRYININNGQQRFILDGKSVHHILNESEQIAEGILTVDWVPIENTIYMGDGEKFNCYNVHTRVNSVIEIPDGYVVYEWNPSQDKIALVNKDGILKTVILDVYNSTCIVSNVYELASIENSSFINIGWGSRETQFKGSEGKNAKQSSDEKAEHFDKTTVIAWREEGDMFAVNFTRDGKRIFKIFSSECEFLFECEYKPGLGAHLAWKPDGSLLAVENNSAHGRKLMFFEKNGLYRFEFKLTSEAPVKKIGWNTIGDMLMVWQKTTANSEISLLTYTNCMWHLKQSLVFNNKENNVNNVTWCDKKCLEIITSKYVLKYTFKWVTHASNANNYDIYEANVNTNIGALAVIDGKSVRITVTGDQIIPPPLCTYTVQCDKAVNHIAFGINTNRLVAILNDNTFKIYDLKSESYEEKFTNKLVSEFPLSLNHFIYDDINSSLYCVQLNDQNECIINKNDIDLTNSKITTQKYNAGACSDTNVLDLISVAEPKGQAFHLGICIENNLQVCHNSDVNDAESFELDQDDFISMEENVDNSGLTSIVYVANKYNAFSLKNHRFYYNGKRVHNNVTSYLFCHGYLLLTTTENKLVCVKLAEKSLNNLEKCYFGNFYMRSLPTGAILISAVPDTRKVILQVPRGELEVINPRVLTINEIDRLLAMKKYSCAYSIMRTDRINPNLLYDINPHRFFVNIEGFISDIHNCDYIDVFLTNLQNYNITEEMYQECFEDHLPEQSFDDKIVTIADKFIDVMKKLDADYYLQSILTAYQCKGTNADLKMALLDLNEARNRERAGTKLRVPVDDTLKYLLQLVPVEKLYHTALILDNIELTIWVVSKSQKDPSEYIPFLQEISEMEPNYRNFKINQHTKNYEEAFTYLVKCDNILDELKEFIEKNSLHHLILPYIDEKNQWYKPMLEMYADYLGAKNLHKECGIIYMKLGEDSRKDALKSFCNGGFMREALTILTLFNENDVETNAMLTKLAEKLVDKKSYQDAAHVYDVVLKNYEEAVSVLIKGNIWSGAYYLAVKNNRNDLLETDVKPALLIYANVLMNVFNDTDHEFKKLKTRLQKLRTEKITQFESGFQDDENYVDVSETALQNVDLESVVSTNYSQASLRTRSSQRSSSTSKKQKRIARKILSMKEGSAFESIAIIRQLYVLIENTQSLVQKVSETCTYLFMFPDYTFKAFELQTFYDKLINLMKTSKEQIWVSEMINPPEPVTVETRAYRHNIEHLDLQYRHPPPDINQEWKTLFSC